MGVSWTVRERLCVIRVEGTYGFDALREAWLEVKNHPDWLEPRAQIVDLRQADSLVGRSTHELRIIGGYFAREYAETNTRCALLVTGGVRYGLMRMVTAWISRTIDIQVFTDETQATRWSMTTDEA